MNHVLRDVGATAQLGWLMGVLTAVFLGVFLYWVWWAYAAGHRAAMDEAARMPFNGGDE
ncbi:MAG: CcoQ/FixQ family Cbb3-type cytochrome c oxidase assembly chaperone [Gemmatimonadota bacterium]